MSDLIPIEEVNAVELFTGDGLADLLAKIKAEVTAFVPDTATVAGRKEIASIAFKVSRSKVAIDNAGKELVAGWKQRAKEVDDSRRVARDFLDALRDRVRKPLTEWEQEQERLEAAEKLQREIEQAHAEAIHMNELWDREQDLRRQQEELDRQRREQERAREAELLAKAQAEREAQLIREAEERERQKAEEALREERYLREKAEREKAEAIEQERRRVEAEERQRKLEEERQRQEQAAREADLEHRRGVHRRAMSALIEGGIRAETAKTVLTLIISGQVPGVNICYRDVAQDQVQEKAA